MVVQVYWCTVGLHTNVTPCERLLVNVTHTAAALTSGCTSPRMLLTLVSMHGGAAVLVLQSDCGPYSCSRCSSQTSAAAVHVHLTA